MARKVFLALQQIMWDRQVMMVCLEILGWMVWMEKMARMENQDQRVLRGPQALKEQLDPQAHLLSFHQACLTPKAHLHCFRE